MSRYVTLHHAVYGVCTPSRCVCTQFCGVRHPNVSISEPRIKRSWIGVFFILLYWPSSSSICSVALLLLHHCRRPLWVVLYRLFPQHGCGTITRTSNAVWGLGSCMQLAEHWRITTLKLGLMAKEKGKQKRVATKKQLYEREIPDFLFSEGLEKKRQSKKKAAKKQILRRNSRFLISDMHVQSKKYGNFVFISRLTAWYILRNTKINVYAALVNGHIYIIMAMLRSRDKNTDFFMILAWLSL